MTSWEVAIIAVCTFLGVGTTVSALTPKPYYAPGDEMAAGVAAVCATIIVLVVLL